MESKLEIARMRACSPLLPEPGGEVVCQCLDEVERLLKIVNDYEENVLYLLESTTRAVRSHEGGCAQEDLMASLCLNYIALRDEAGRRKI